MNISDRIFLLKSGYTKEEIEAFERGEEIPAKSNPENKDSDAEKIEHPSAESQEMSNSDLAGTATNEKPQEPETETDKLLKALGLKLDTAISAMRKSNINNIEGTGAKPLTTEDVLAQIINPTIKGGKA